MNEFQGSMNKRSENLLGLERWLDFVNYLKLVLKRASPEGVEGGVGSMHARVKS
jgi:hypothetical protein